MMSLPVGYVRFFRLCELRELLEQQVWLVRGRRGGVFCPFNNCDVLGPLPGVFPWSLFPLNLNTELGRLGALDEAPGVRGRRGRKGRCTKGRGGAFVWMRTLYVKSPPVSLQ